MTVRCHTCSAELASSTSTPVPFAVDERWCTSCEDEYRVTSSFPVTDDALDAPDGAIVAGYKRVGSTWWRNLPLAHPFFLVSPTNRPSNERNHETPLS